MGAWLASCVTMTRNLPCKMRACFCCSQPPPAMPWTHPCTPSSSSPKVRRGPAARWVAPLRTEGLTCMRAGCDVQATTRWPWCGAMATRAPFTHLNNSRTWLLHKGNNDTLKQKSGPHSRSFSKPSTRPRVAVNPASARSFTSSSLRMVGTSSGPTVAAGSETCSRSTGGTTQRTHANQRVTRYPVQLRPVGHRNSNAYTSLLNWGPSQRLPMQWLSCSRPLSGRGQRPWARSTPPRSETAHRHLKSWY